LTKYRGFADGTLRRNEVFSDEMNFGNDF